MGAELDRVAAEHVEGADELQQLRIGVTDVLQGDRVLRCQVNRPADTAGHRVVTVQTGGRGDRGINREIIARDVELTAVAAGVARKRIAVATIQTHICAKREIAGGDCQIKCIRRCNQGSAIYAVQICTSRKNQILSINRNRAGRVGSEIRAADR